MRHKESPYDVSDYLFHTAHDHMPKRIVLNVWKIVLGENDKLHMHHNISIPGAISNVNLSNPCAKI